MLSERNRRLVDEHLDAIAVYDEEQMNRLLDAARSEAEERVKGLVEALGRLTAYIGALPSTDDTIAAYEDGMAALRAVSGSVPSPIGEGAWRPIESAPKDGTRVIMWGPEWDGPQTHQWPDAARAAEELRHWQNPPTYWQPLPDPPPSQPSKIDPIHQPREGGRG